MFNSKEKNILLAINIYDENLFWRFTGKLDKNQLIDTR